MRKSNSFGQLVINILGMGNLDHPDLEKIDAMGQKIGLSQRQTRQAFFVARDKKTLIESEWIDGGTGKSARRTNDTHILTVNQSHGELKG
jgi:hypothetical protein